MQNIFRTIQSRLKDVNGQVAEGNALKRINTLSGLISGMIRKGSSHLEAIGSGLPQDIDAHSKTVAAKRFVANKWTDYDHHFLPFLQAFLSGVVAYLTDLSQGITLVIDGSQVGKDNAVLMISLVWHKRGIPICWFVKSGSKGHFKVQDHLQVLEDAAKILQHIIPTHIPVRLLGDGEFDAIEIQELCLSVGWDYVLRTACNTVLFEQKEYEEQDYCEQDRFQARNICPDSTHEVFFIPQVAFTNKKFEYVNFLCWHDSNRHDEAIYLISNLWCPELIIQYYDLRYSIECLFKDLKSSSFNIHKTRLKKPQEVANLLIIACLAFILLTVLAIQFDTKEWRKKVQRVRKNRKVLSFFAFAFKLIDYFDKYDISFNFSFQFSKNSC